MNPSSDPRPTDDTELGNTTPDTTGYVPEPETTPEVQVNNPTDTPTPVQQAPLSTPLVQPTPVPDPEPAPIVVQPKRPARKGLIILLILTILVAAGVAGYFIWQSMQPVPAADTQTSTTEEAADTTVDSSTDVEGEAAGAESDLDSLDSSEFDDSTLNDQTLSE